MCCFDSLQPVLVPNHARPMFPSEVAIYFGFGISYLLMAEWMNSNSWRIPNREHFYRMFVHLTEIMIGNAVSLHECTSPGLSHSGWEDVPSEWISRETYLLRTDESTFGLTRQRAMLHVASRPWSHRANFIWNWVEDYTRSILSHLSLACHPVIRGTSLCSQQIWNIKIRIMSGMSMFKLE